MTVATAGPGIAERSRARGSLIPMIIAAVVILLVSVAFPFLIHACATGRIRSNPFVGIRIASVMASEAAWREGHRAALPTVWVGAPIAVILAAIALLASLSVEAQRTLVLVAAGVLIVSVIVGGVFANRAALAVSSESVEEQH